MYSQAKQIVVILNDRINNADYSNIWKIQDWEDIFGEIMKQPLKELKPIRTDGKENDSLDEIAVKLSQLRHFACDARIKAMNIHNASELEELKQARQIGQ